MDKITPHLWYDKEAVEAAEFYCSTFPNSKVTDVTTLRNTPSGDADIVTFAAEPERPVGPDAPHRHGVGTAVSSSQAFLPSNRFASISSPSRDWRGG